MKKLFANIVILSLFFIFIGIASADTKAVPWIPLLLLDAVPIADAGPDQNVTTGSTVILDGSGSSDADQDPLTYSWAFTSMPDDSVATLSNVNIVNPIFTPDVSGIYIISLTVNDGNDSSSDSVVITVTAAFVIKNLGVTFGEWDPLTDKAGSFNFVLSSDKVFLEFGAIVTDQYGNPKELPTFEYIVDKDANVFAIADGEVKTITWQDDSQDYEISVWSNTTPHYEVYYDHVLDVQISEGDLIIAGDLIGKPGPRGGGLGRIEIMINNGNLGKSYCPFVLFDPDLKESFEQQVEQLMGDWEDFKDNSDIYDQENHLFPGCRYETMDM